MQRIKAGAVDPFWIEKLISVAGDRTVARKTIVLIEADESDRTDPRRLKACKHCKVFLKTNTESTVTLKISPNALASSSRETILHFFVMSFGGRLIALVWLSNKRSLRIE